MSEPIPADAWAEIRIEFKDGTSTMFHASPDDNESDAVVAHVEEQGWSLDDIEGWSFTGNYAYPGE